MRNAGGGFRDPARLHGVAARLARAAGDRELRLMHVCGTHENAIARFGLRSLLPPGVRVIAGPGCPVCVCPPGDIELAATLALDRGVTLCTFGDMVPVPGRTSLQAARARGAGVRVVTGAADAVALARRAPEREVVFFAVGFETTACTTAAALLADPPANLSVLVSHRTIPAALEALVARPELRLDGFLLPGHVATVTGTEPYEALAGRVARPMVAAGFEPLDVMHGLAELVEAAVAGGGAVGNAYPRAVRAAGNPRARQMMDRVFAVVDAPWRGLGTIPASGLVLRDAFAAHDALRRLGVAPDPALPDSLPGCRCSDVMAGLIEPPECALFADTCTPEAPRGPCMVSFEGTCRNRYLYRDVE